MVVPSRQTTMVCPPLRFSHCCCFASSWAFSCAPRVHSAAASPILSFHRVFLFSSFHHTWEKWRNFYFFFSFLLFYFFSVGVAFGRRVLCHGAHFRSRWSPRYSLHYRTGYTGFSTHLFCPTTVWRRHQGCRRRKSEGPKMGDEKGGPWARPPPPPPPDDVSHSNATPRFPPGPPRVQTSARRRGTVEAVEGGSTGSPPPAGADAPARRTAASNSHTPSSV